MKHFKPELFKNKDWGTNTVLQHTLEDLKGERLALLASKNDVDHFEDIKANPVFASYLEHM
jgi:glycosyltransferase A (GT-A) superfamily protein (DUF2064 family)